MTEIVRLLGAFALALLPAWAFTASASRRRDLFSLMGAVPFAFALLLFAAAAAARIGHLVWAAYALCAAAPVAVWFLWRGRFSPRRLRLGGATAAVFALVALFQLLGTVTRLFPAGWDPACHALITDRILETGRLCADWRPFETIPMRYPQAFHAMTALLALLAGLPVHRVLQGLHFLLMFPAGWLVWDFARRGFGRRAALPAFVIFAGLTNTGNYLYFYRMGMLPTELGFLFFLGTFACALRWRPRRFGPLAAGWLLLAATALMHPLSLAMSGAVWLGVWLTSPRRRSAGSRRGVSSLRAATKASGSRRRAPCRGGRS